MKHYIDNVVADRRKTSDGVIQREGQIHKRSSRRGTTNRWPQRPRMLFRSNERPKRENGFVREDGKFIIENERCVERPAVDNTNRKHNCYDCNPRGRTTARSGQQTLR
jgi:hypothetical protein